MIKINLYIMTLYICNKCKMSFDDKSNYSRHITRKIQCVKNNDVNICKFCNKKIILNI